MKKRKLIRIITNWPVSCHQIAAVRRVRRAKRRGEAFSQEDAYLVDELLQELVECYEAVR